jgi:hypothetical protein
MVLTPQLTIGGGDYSRYFLSCHCEQTSSDIKDDNKYDVTLANINGRLTGMFVPKTKISLTVINQRRNCEEASDDPILIFNGEVQDVSANEIICKISGSCDQGGMTSGIEQEKRYPENYTFTDIVNDILDMYGYTGGRFIQPANDIPPQKNFIIYLSEDFNSAMQEVADYADSAWYWGENGTFYFVPPNMVFCDMGLTGYLLESQISQNMEGYCNVIRVIGGSPGPLPSEDGSENKSHKLIYAEAQEADFDDYGVMNAPVMSVPHCNGELCQKIADNSKSWFLQFRDVTSVKVVGIAPFIHTKVDYVPYNGVLPSNDCDESAGSVPAGIEGMVTRRVVDFSSDGLICTLDINTHFEGADFEDIHYEGVEFIYDD